MLYVNHYINLQVLGHRNTHFAKQAGTYIYNMVTTVLTYPAESTNQHPAALWSEQEPKYFYFVEELLLPFERAVQSEDCDNEVQGLVCYHACFSFDLAILSFQVFGFSFFGYTIFSLFLLVFFISVIFCVLRLFNIIFKPFNIDIIIKVFRLTL